MYKATMTSKGQITIPKPLRERMGLNDGSIINFIINDAGEIIMKKEEEEQQYECILKHDQYVLTVNVFSTSSDPEQIEKLARERARELLRLTHGIGSFEDSDMKFVQCTLVRGV